MNTLNWFPFSIVSVVLFGVAMALYKLPSAKTQSKAATAFWMLASSTVLSAIVFYQYLAIPNASTIWFALAWGIGFALISILQMYALGHVDTNSLFPITTTISLVGSVLLGLFLFSDSLSLVQIAGIVVGIVTVYLFLYKGGNLQYSKGVVVIGSSIIVLSVFNKIVQKFAADSVNIQNYQVWQYLFGTLCALVIFFIYNRREWRGQLFSGAIKTGLLISIPSFLGGWALLVALTKGPFSLITALHSMYIFVTALTAHLLFKESFTIRKVLLICLAIGAILLIRLG